MHLNKFGCNAVEKVKPYLILETGMLYLLKAFYFETQEIEYDLFEEAIKCQFVVMEIVVDRNFLQFYWNCFANINEHFIVL